MEPHIEPMLLSEVAKALEYNEAYLRQLLRRGVIRGFQMGPTWVLLSDDVYSFKKPQRGRPPKPRRKYTKHNAQYWGQFKGGTE